MLAILALSLVAASHPDHIDTSVLAINATTYRALEALASSTIYSLVRTKDLGSFAPPARCTLFSCLVKRTSIFDEEYIDLLKTREAYTAYKSNRGSGEAWRKIWEISSRDSLLPTLVSGLQFSILTHLCSFHRRFLGTYLPNPLLFLRRFRDPHRLNFHLTYLLVRSCVGTMEADPDLQGVARTIAAQGLWIPRDVDLSESIRRIDEMVGLLRHVDCEKCQLWGTIQLKGLRAALKVASGAPLDGLERFFLVNLFMRLSVSVRESIKLRRFWAPRLATAALYWVEVLSLAASVAAILLARGIHRRLKSKVALKSCG